MGDWKEKIKQDFESKLPQTPKFTPQSLPSDEQEVPMPESKRGNIVRGVIKWAGIAGIFAMVGAVVFPIVVPIISLFVQIDNKPRLYVKTYTKQESQLIQSQSFASLNQIEYPSTAVEKHAVSNEFKQAVYQFTVNAYTHARVSTENFSFSPLGLYSNLTVLSTATNNQTAVEAFNNVLGLDYATRAENYVNAYKSDYFITDTGTMQMYNGWFMDEKFGAFTPSVNEKLTELFTETYKLDLQKKADVQKMLGWVDGKVGEKGFFPESELKLDKDSALYLFTTLYFNNRWATTFNTLNTKRGEFTTPSGKVTAPFMAHSYMGAVYDRDDYLACYDHYKNDMKVKYILPKDEKADLGSLMTEEIFKDNPSQRVLTKNATDPVINLKVPKFETESFIDFSEAISDMGMSYLFNKKEKVFNHAFSDTDEYFICLDMVKQKNKVSFSEDGTVIKTVTASGSKGYATAMPMETIDITLDRPFIYIIYDANDLPVYIGNVENPILK